MFSGKNIILCILKGEMPFKMHKIIMFSRKKIVPILPKIFRPVTGYLALLIIHFQEHLSGIQEKFDLNRPYKERGYIPEARLRGFRNRNTPGMDAA